jgi:MFS family permease
VSDRGWLLAICLAEMGTMLVFSSFSALLPILKVEWSLTNTEAGLILAFYQVGYIGLVAVLATLTDYMPPRRIYLASAAWTSLTSLAFAWWAGGFVSALVLRTLVGLGLAGTYMPGMRMVAERFTRGGRGFAMGCYIGSFTLGTSISLLVTGWANSLWGWRVAFAVTALGPAAAVFIGSWALPVAMTRTAPPATVPGRGGGLGPVLRNTSALRLIIAYVAHTFELMGMRLWIAPFFTASLMATGAGLTQATERAALAASAVLAVGALPHPFSGLLSDRFGRARPISAVMLLSAACSLVIGWGLHWPFAALVPLGLLYGVLVTAESAIVSTGIADVAEPSHLGRTMAVQSAAGFAAGAMGPAVFGAMLDLAPALGASPESRWVWAFAVLGVVALAGPLAVGFKDFSPRETAV